MGVIHRSVHSREMPLTPASLQISPPQAVAPLCLLPLMAIILLGWTKVTSEFGGRWLK